MLPIIHGKLEVVSLIDDQIAWHAGSRGVPNQVPNSVKGHDFIFNGIII